MKRNIWKWKRKRKLPSSTNTPKNNITLNYAKIINNKNVYVKVVIYLWLQIYPSCLQCAFQCIVEILCWHTSRMCVEPSPATLHTATYSGKLNNNIAHNMHILYGKFTTIRLLPRSVDIENCMQNLMGIVNEGGGRTWCHSMPSSIFNELHSFASVFYSHIFQQCAIAAAAAATCNYSSKNKIKY